MVCTIGPSSNTYETIYAMAQAGMNVARLNFSHGNHEEHKAVIEILKQVSHDLQKPIGILQDLQGPKIRVGKFENGEIHLKRGDDFSLSIETIPGTQEAVSVSYKGLINDVHPGNHILLDDGLLMLEVKDIKNPMVNCKVLRGGVLKNNKGLNLPGSKVSIDVLTEKDKKDLMFGLEMEVDFIALSFVQSAKDITYVKNLLSFHSMDIPVIAKIEKPQAVDDIEHIIDIADGIMIARGDLGVEMRVEEVPIIQKKIIRLCNEKSKPVITATQMLESMVTNHRPTRAEASDVANAIIDGSDAVMLSAESASGKFPVESVQTMVRIISHTEQAQRQAGVTKQYKKEKSTTTPRAICAAACHSAEMVNAQAIICLTLRGWVARTLSRYRPTKSIIAVSSNEKALRYLSIHWGVYPIWMEDLTKEISESVDELMENLKNQELVKQSDTLVVLAGLPFDKNGPTNCLQIRKVP